MANDVRRRLRDATAQEHQRLEDRLDIFSRIATTAGRRNLALRFFALHAGAEAALLPFLGDLDGLEFQARRRTSHLLADLAALDAEPGTAAHVTCGGLGEALGWMYVLEGSTLGGKVIGRRVAEAGDGLEGLSFLDPYGELGGERWRSFLEVLEREGAPPEVCEQIVDGALAAFRRAEAVLCEPVAA